MPLPPREGNPHRFAILPAKNHRFIAKTAVHAACRCPAGRQAPLFCYNFRKFCPFYSKSSHFKCSAGPAGASWGGQERFFAITFNKSTTFIANCRLFSNGRRLLRGRFLRFCHNSGAKLLFYSKTPSSWHLSGPRRGTNRLAGALIAPARAFSGSGTSGTTPARAFSGSGASGSTPLRAFFTGFRAAALGEGGVAKALGA